MLHLLFLWSILVHPHHVTVTEMIFDQDEAIFETSITFIGHDLEKALSNIHHRTIKLSSPQDSIVNDSILKEYIERNLHLSLNTNNIEFDFLGFEQEKDEITVFLQSETVDFMPVDIILENTLLCESFAEQQNIVHFSYGKFNKNLKLSPIKSKIVLKME